MGYFQTDVAIEGFCQLPKSFLEEKYFRKISYYMVHFGLLLSCYSVRKGKSASYIGFFFAILPDFTWFFLLGDLRLHSCWTYCDETGIKSMIIIIDNITIVYCIHIYHPLTEKLFLIINIVYPQSKLFTFMKNHSRKYVKYFPKQIPIM